MSDEPADNPTPTGRTYGPGIIAAGAVGLIGLVIALAAWAGHVPQAAKEPEVNWRALYDKEQENEKRIAAIEDKLGMTKQP